MMVKNDNSNQINIQELSLGIYYLNGLADGRKFVH
jgi:hypothetical protein